MKMLKAQMSPRRLQMVAKLRRITLQHQCQQLSAGGGVDIDGDGRISARLDGTNVYLDSQGRITLALPSTKLVSEYLGIIEDELPRSKTSNCGMALRSDGANSASWHRVGEYYYCASYGDETRTMPDGTVKSREIDELFARS